MDRITKKFRKIVKGYGYIGIVIAYLGFFLILYVILQSAFDIILQKPGAVGGGPVLPGFEIPGLGIKIPLIIGWISLFIIMIVHEFSHGIVARAHKVKVKSSGVGVLGPLPLAFVEPDEAELEKQSHKVQHSIFAAGPFSNIILWLVCIGLLLFTVNIVKAITTAEGVHIGIIQNESLPAMSSGLPDNSTLIRINNYSITTVASLESALDKLSPGEEILVETNTGQIYNMTTTRSPDNESKAYMGILLYGVDRSLKEDNFINGISYKVLLWLNDLFWWTQLLSINIGLINLFPVFITDGARMLKLNVEYLVKDKKKAEKIWKNANIAGLVLIFVLLSKFFTDVITSILNIFMTIFFNFLK